MRFFILAIATAAACIPAQATTCDEFLAGFEASDAERANVLPTLDLRKEAHAPDGFSIENLKNIDASISCQGGVLGGVLQGIGASLISGEEPDLDRWSLFLLATADGAGVAAQTLIDLQSEAIDAAGRERIGTGLYVGGAEATEGPFSISYTVMQNQLEFSISR